MMAADDEINKLIKEIQRRTIYLRQNERGWEWSQTPDIPRSWWGFWSGFYDKRGGKRRVPNTIGGKYDPSDFEFIEVK